MKDLPFLFKIQGLPYFQISRLEWRTRNAMQHVEKKTVVLTYFFGPSSLILEIRQLLLCISTLHN